MPDTTDHPPPPAISAEYYYLMQHLRDARAALRRAQNALDLLDPAELQRHVALDDVVLGVQAVAGLVGERTGTNERERAYERSAAAVRSPERAPLQSPGLDQAADYLARADREAQDSPEPGSAAEALAEREIGQ